MFIFAEKYLYKEADKIDSRIKDTSDMLDIIDDDDDVYNNNNNNSNNNNMITDIPILESFDIANMFPNIDNIPGLEAVSEIQSNR